MNLFQVLLTIVDSLTDLRLAVNKAKELIYLLSALLKTEVLNFLQHSKTYNYYKSNVLVSGFKLRALNNNNSTTDIDYLCS